MMHWSLCADNTCSNVVSEHTEDNTVLFSLWNMIWRFIDCLVEMGRSSVNAEVRLNNSAECLARFGSATCDYSAEVRLNFGKNLASLAALLSRYFAAFLRSRRR